MNLCSKFLKKTVELEWKRSKFKKGKAEELFLGERVATLSDDKNDENVPCSSKQKKNRKKTYSSVESVVRNGMKMEMIGGLFAIFVAKLIIYNAVYNTKHHNTGRFSLMKLSLSVKNAN